MSFVLTVNIVCSPHVLGVPFFVCFWQVLVALASTNAPHYKTQVVGFLAYRPDTVVVTEEGGEEKEELAIYLEAYCTLPTFRGKGVGGELLRVFFKSVEQVRVVSAYVAPNNTQSQRLLEAAAKVVDREMSSNEMTAGGRYNVWEFVKRG